MSRLSTAHALPASVTMEDAAAALRGVEAALAGLAHGASLRLDASALTSLDTAALALVLQAQRLAAVRGVSVELAEAPRQLRELAALYGVASLLLSAEGGGSSRASGGST